MRYRPASRHRQASCPHSSGSIAAAIVGGGARKIQLSLPKPLPFAQVEDGAQCPVTMTYAVMTVMQRHSAVARGPRGAAGAGRGTRTPDLRFTKPLLYQLS